MNTSGFPSRRVVIEFHLDGRPERYWVVFEASGCSICEADPGFDVDVTVAAALPDLYRVFYHQLDIAAAVKAGRLRFDGEKALVRRMPSMLDLLPPDLLGVDAASPRPTWRPT